ncbi:MAG: glycosyltransferase family 2 protein [Anaerolineae bacterium]
MTVVSEASANVCPGAGPSLSGVILTLNEEKHIEACIDSLRWTDKVVVLDSGSEDSTQQLAEMAGATVVVHPFENYAQQRNVALSRVRSDWVLFVDADERATPELAVETRAVIAERPETGWWIPRFNYIMGHRMRATGWYPDYQMRLLRRDAAHYDPARGVHELVKLAGDAGYMASHLIHYNYETLSQFWAKQRRYLQYDIDVLLASGAQPKFHSPYTQALRHMWWRFVTLEGWRDTVWGLLLSALMGYYELLKYREVRRARRMHATGEEAS